MTDEERRQEAYRHAKPGRMVLWSDSRDTVHMECPVCRSPCRCKLRAGAAGLDVSCEKCDWTGEWPDDPVTPYGPPAIRWTEPRRQRGCITFDGFPTEHNCSPVVWFQIDADHTLSMWGSMLNQATPHDSEDAAREAVETFARDAYLRLLHESLIRIETERAVVLGALHLMGAS